MYRALLWWQAMEGASTSTTLVCRLPRRLHSILQTGVARDPAQGTGAVSVHSGEQSAQLRNHNSGRILSSRMVRRWKAQDGPFDAPKAKSRFCAHSHTDPNTQWLKVYSPTPQTETLMLALEVVAKMGFGKAGPVRAVRKVEEEARSSSRRATVLG